MQKFCFHFSNHLTIYHKSGKPTTFNTSIETSPGWEMLLKNNVYPMLLFLKCKGEIYIHIQLYIQKKVYVKTHKNLVIGVNYWQPDRMNIW